MIKGDPKYVEGGKVHHLAKFIDRGGAIVAQCGRRLTGELIISSTPPNTPRCKKCAKAYPIKEKDMNKKEPIKKSSAINPKHYDIVVNGQPIQVVDLIEAIYPDDAHMSQALKYMLRAGRKSESSFVQDVQKCIWWLVRALMFQKVKYIELPNGAPIK